MISIGITGQSGFIGRHLYNHFKLFKEDFDVIAFEDSFFNKAEKLDAWVKKCQYIIHLAAENKNQDQSLLFKTNIALVDKLTESLVRCESKAHILFASSVQESIGGEYGRSKREGREKLIDFASRNKSGFTGLIIPNVYGPFGKPDYNSFAATFCYRLVNNEMPEIIVDSQVKLLYVSNLCGYIIDRIRLLEQKPGKSIEKEVNVPPDFERKVSEVLNDLNEFKSLYLDKGLIPKLADQYQINLFNTFRSYIDYSVHFPIALTKHSDNRGYFAEVIRSEISQGQFSYSSTVPGITRGNHYHIRKIERFTVIKGEAIIQLRRIGTEKIIKLRLSGDIPSCVDIPIWYTHSITNIGSEELVTLFWINELYKPDDSDTYFEEV